MGEKVLIIGGGNTAMDCCRTSLRLGGKDVKVIYRGERHTMKSSDWELEPALEENVDLVLCHSPEEYIVEDGKLTGMRFSIMEYSVDDEGKGNRRKSMRQSSHVIRSFWPLDKRIHFHGLNVI